MNALHHIQRCRVFIRTLTSSTDVFFSQPVHVPICTPDVPGSVHPRIPNRSMRQLLNQFSSRPMVHDLAAEHGINPSLFSKAMQLYRSHLSLCTAFPQDLYYTFDDILNGAGHVDDIFPFFMEFCKSAYPILNCMEDLRGISDLTDPPRWYPDTRLMKRKIIYHAGPTNSGKTYQAMQAFRKAEKGIYCGPLKLLASENFHRTNSLGVNCDLVTGEERLFANANGEPSNHSACTVEMVNCNQLYDVCVIDEIQLVRDVQRGWAWTRAFLGVQAEEVHVCGELAGVEIIKKLADDCGDEFELRVYDRLTKLRISNTALDSLNFVEPGDCIVAFNKQDIFSICQQLIALGKRFAVIYGAMPPNAKYDQARRFNDPDDPLDILVASDAVGMGLNLSIKRMIFYSMQKIEVDVEGRVKQIAGRAGRFGSHYPEGEVTTIGNKNLKILHSVMNQDIEPVKRAGLSPLADQVESFSYHLPDSSLSQLIEIFCGIATVSENYFISNMNDFQAIAKLIDKIELPLRVRYTFCCSPTNVRRHAIISTMTLKFARAYSDGIAATADWFAKNIGWPFNPPKRITHLSFLEAVHDVMDLYCWFSYRLPDIFVHVDQVRVMQKELDDIISKGFDEIGSIVQPTRSSSKRFSNQSIETRHFRFNTSNRLTCDDFLTDIPYTRKLVLRGVLTNDMVSEIRQEILESLKNRPLQDSD